MDMAFRDVLRRCHELSGVVPQELGMLTILQRLKLGYNSLSNGHCAMVCVLDALSNCSILEVLSLAGNKFRCKLSRAIGSLSPRLSNLYLDDNDLSGNILEEIGNLTELIIFSLVSNNITG
ncbi:hypothetical protein SUGI_0223470 [Cryptomeria japonica]|nr:hypothetical protein SUGI_0223470 [Cryptomeria japonica]